MSAITHDLLVRGKAAVKSGETSDAVRYFTRLLGLEPEVSEQIEAWQWLSDLSEDPALKRKYLEEILARNPGDPLARRKLAELTGLIKTNEIVNPDQLSISPPTQPVRSAFQRFSCAACGSRMVYSADETELICENCGSRRPAGGLKSRTIGKQENFSAVMATAQGHTTPSRVKITVCHGCGAEFQIPPRSLSANCPYCGSSYAAGQSVEKDVLLPSCLIPFKISFNGVRRVLQTWIKNQGIGKNPNLGLPYGYYIPVWSFSIGGQLSWVCSIHRDERWEPLRDAKVLLQPDVLVLGTQRLPQISENLLSTYELDEQVNYDPHYLADWPSETYQLSLGDASLLARKQVLDEEKEQIPSQYSSRITNLKIDTSSMAVDTVKLILLPIWLATYQTNQQSFDVAVNGQNGLVIGQQAAAGLSDWINNMFGR